MKKLLMLSCVLILATAASAEQLLYSIPDFAGGVDMLMVQDATSWSNLQASGMGDRTAAQYKGFYWTPSGGLVTLQGSGSLTLSMAYGISDSGNVIVGNVSDGTTNTAAVWDSTGAVTLKIGANLSGGVSGDGLVAAGASTAAANKGQSVNLSTNTVNTTLTGTKDAVVIDGDQGKYFAGRWTATTGNRAAVVGRNGTTVRLPGTGTATATSLTTPRGITDDGVTVYGLIANSITAKIWTWNGSAYAITGTVPGTGAGEDKFDLKGISGDGRYVVGNITKQTAIGGDGIARPFIWDTTKANAELLSTFLSAGALAYIPSGYTLDNIMGISNDGSTIFGSMSSGASIIGFVAKVPEPATIALLGLGGLALIRRKK